MFKQQLQKYRGLAVLNAVVLRAVYTVPDAIYSVKHADHFPSDSSFSSLSEVFLISSIPSLSG